MIIIQNVWRNAFYCVPPGDSTVPRLFINTPKCSPCLLVSLRQLATSQCFLRRGWGWGRGRGRGERRAAAGLGGAAGGAEGAGGARTARLPGGTSLKKTARARLRALSLCSPTQLWQRERCGGQSAQRRRGAMRDAPARAEHKSPLVATRHRGAGSWKGLWVPRCPSSTTHALPGCCPGGNGG